MKSSHLAFLFVLYYFLPLHFVNAANYYWVGGSGNWSDYANHWATTSGGNVLRTQVPNSFDDVYFDANSFTTTGQTVNADTTIVYCRDMNWTGATNNPTFASSNSSIELKVFGSLTLNAAMNFSFNGKLTFTALTPGKTISTFGRTLSCPIEFNGAGGEWGMLDSLTSTKNITLTYGTLRTNDNNIKCLSLLSYNTNARALYLGTSTIILTYGSSYSWRVSRSLILDADSSIIRLNDDGVFNSQGHIYNIVQWDSTGSGYWNELSNDSLKISKVIAYNSNASALLRVRCRACQIDTMILLGSYRAENGNGNKISYVSANHYIDYRTSGYGDSVSNMILRGSATFGISNYISKLVVDGNLILQGGVQTFDTCEVYGNGSFSSDGNDLGILKITQGKTFTFGANKMQTIDSLIPISTPAFPIQLVSSDLGLAANVVINSSLCTDYLYIHGIHATGNNALYVGTHSNDVTNNTGWIFSSCVPISCSAFFDLLPDTIQHHYFAINMASGIPPLTYLWEWGDGATDTAAFPSHTYSAAGFYNICLTVSDSLGCTNTYCNSYNLQKTSSAMVQVNVIAQIATATIPYDYERIISVYPNPATHTLEVSLNKHNINTKIQLFDLAGKLKLSVILPEANSKLDVKDLPVGIYIVEIADGNTMWRQKLVKQ